MKATEELAESQTLSQSVKMPRLMSGKLRLSSVFTQSKLPTYASFFDDESEYLVSSNSLNTKEAAAGPIRGVSSIAFATFPKLWYATTNNTAM